MKFSNQVFDNQQILLDGNEFIDCTFNKCHIETAGILVGISRGCKFDRCTWGFIGPAATTISFMAALYAQGGQAPDMVETWFEQIRKNKVIMPKH